MKTQHQIFLVALSVIAGIIWRSEVEFYGWHGLEWIRHGNVSLLTGLLLLAIWLFFTSSPKIRKATFWLFPCAAIASIPIHGFLFALGYLLFMAGPGAIGLYFLGGPVVTKSIAIVVFLLLPSLLYWGGRLLGCRTPWRYLGIAYVLYIFSWPLCCGILAVIRHPGTPDMIHAIKSGLIVPFLFAGTAIILYDPPREAESVVT